MVLAAERDMEEWRARLARARLRKAGLSGEYLRADCELGRRVLELAQGRRGAYLWGGCGRGKTYAAACAVRMAVQAVPPTGQLPAMLVPVTGLLGELRDAYRGGRAPDLGRLGRVALLALDDLGCERPTAWAMETVTALLDERVRHGLPTVVTSNHSIGQLRDAWGGVEGARLASRLAGACEVIEVGGTDRRLHA